MNEQELAERFCLDLEKMLQNPSGEIIPAGPVPDEYIQAIDLARFMVLAGLAGQCTIREELRRSLLARLVKGESGRAGGLGDGGELDDDQLDMVAAGIGSEAHGDRNSVCGCGSGAPAASGGVCPDCGRIRG